VGAASLPVGSLTVCAKMWTKRNSSTARSWLSPWLRSCFLFSSSREAIALGASPSDLRAVSTKQFWDPPYQSSAPTSTRSANPHGSSLPSFVSIRSYQRPCLESLLVTQASFLLVFGQLLMMYDQKII
jgi:hypothetical protein